jgi:outer membrane protein assembly factor BamA
VFPVRPDRRRDALRLGWSLSSARIYGYSISAEEGAAINVVGEFASGGPSGSRGSATSAAGSVRGYLRTWPAHGVLAVRAAGAASRGDAQVRREFSAGGPGPRGGGFDIGVDAIGLLRGFPEGDLSGRSTAVVNTDYRFPLGWPQRGFGTVPVFLRAVHGAVFADLGRTWETGLRSSSWRRSIGGELSVDTVLGSVIPVTFAGGVAWRHDPYGMHEGAALFARIGRAF